MFAVAPTIKEEFSGLTLVFILYGFAVLSFLEVVIDTAVFKLRPWRLVFINSIRDQAFSRLWLRISGPTPDPPEGSAALIPPLLATAKGTVLEIGPGSGTQMALLGQNSKITRVYGVEPATGLHDQLRQAARDAGMSDSYEIVTAGAEASSLLPALANQGLFNSQQRSSGCKDDRAIFDTIITIRVLCSVPDPAATIANLYRLLKPGGRWIVVEHVKNPWRLPKGSLPARLVQLFMTLYGWSFFMGDCDLQRDTGALLEAVADEDSGWDGHPGGEVLKAHFGYSVLPYVSGVMVKRWV